MSQGTDRATNGQRTATIAGLLGVTGALILGAVRFSGQEAPLLREQLAGNLVFALVMVSPYLLALAIARSNNAAARGSLLMALAVLSLVASFIGLSGITLLLLPATMAMCVATVLSFREAGARIIRAPLFLIPGFLAAALIGSSFFALFLVQADEPRCWSLAQVGDQEEWQPRPVPPQSDSGGITLGGSPGPDGRRGLCTSDIITNQEAGLGLAALSAGVLVFLTASRLGSPGRSREKFSMGQ